MVELETNRVLIREVLASDADDFLRYRQVADYWRHIPIEPPTANPLQHWWTAGYRTNLEIPELPIIWQPSISVPVNLVGDAGPLSMIALFDVVRSEVFDGLPGSASRAL